MIAIEGLHALEQALAQLDLAATQRAALDKAAQQLDAAVKQELSHRPGEDHVFPWYRSGALHNSISHEAEGDRAVIGSADPVAVYQELGTRTDPPRPFLAAAASARAEAIAHEIGEVVATALKEALR